MNLATKHLLHLFAVFAVTVVLTTTVASVAGTQVVLAQLDALGVSVSIADRINTTWQDLLGLGLFISPVLGFSYGAIIAIGLFIAFISAGIVSHWLPTLRKIVYTVAASVAIMTILVVSYQIFEVVLFAFARTPFGYLSQVGAGAIGGWFFSVLTAPKGDA